jgi:hypothetical protein
VADVDGTRTAVAAWATAAYRSEAVTLSHAEQAALLWTTTPPGGDDA